MRLAGEDRVRRDPRDASRARRRGIAPREHAARSRRSSAPDNVLAGKLLKTGGDRLRIEATLQRAGTQDTSSAPIIVDGEGDAAIQSMIGELTPKILEALGYPRAGSNGRARAPKPTAHSPEALALHGQGLALMHAGNYAEASRKLEDAVQKDPGFSIARALLAATYQRQGESDKAKAEAKKAAENLATASPYEAARIQATGALIDGDLEAAEKRLSEPLRDHAVGCRGVLRSAQVRVQQGNFKGALEAYRAFSRSTRTALEGSRRDRGRRSYQFGNADEAIRELNTAVTLYEETGNDLGKGSVLNGLGIILRGPGAVRGGA